MKFVFFVKSRLIFNAFYCCTHSIYEQITREFLHTEMNTYSKENFTFLIVIIHFNMYLFECIERLSYFYLHICDKDLRHKLSLEK